MKRMNETIDPTAEARADSRRVYIQASSLAMDHRVRYFPPPPNRNQGIKAYNNF